MTDAATMVQPLEPRVQMTGTLAFHDAFGNVICTTELTLTKPLAELVEQPGEQPVEPKE